MNLPVYFDHASTTPLLEEVLESMIPYLKDLYGNVSSRHHAYGWLAEEAFKQANTQVKKLLSAPEHQVIFTSGATESINTILQHHAGSPDLEFISVKTEHKATLDVLAYLSQQTVHYLPVDSHGQINLSILENILKNTSKKYLLTLMWVNNETGLLHPIENILALKDTYDFKIHIDATQAIGKFEINMDKIDFLSFSAHKIYGPKGMGVLMTNEKIASLIKGGGQQQNQRSGTINLPGVVGLAKALELACAQIPQYEAYHQKLVDTVLTSLNEHGIDYKINGLLSQSVSNILNISLPNSDSEMILQRIAHKFALSNGSACNSASILPSHVLTAMGQTPMEASSSIRFSFGWQNTVAQAKDCIDLLAEIIKKDLSKY